MASMTDEELTNLMGPASGTTAKRRKKKKAIPAFGSLARRRRLLRNSKNLRFKEVYKPITPTVALCFIFVAGSIYGFLHWHVFSKQGKK
mmetsp:Transcript_10049/g.20528  ORF Transcript_10049/g.20528 Transcript_10049/m.20528 type:complete len:89 (+) Transcript_10049:174-440(+)